MADTFTSQCPTLRWLLEQSVTDRWVHTHKMIISRCSGEYRSETGHRDRQVLASAPCLVVEGELTRLCSQGEWMRDLIEAPFTRALAPLTRAPPSRPNHLPKAPPSSTWISNMGNTDMLSGFYLDHWLLIAGDDREQDGRMASPTQWT